MKVQNNNKLIYYSSSTSAVEKITRLGNCLITITPLVCTGVIALKCFEVITLSNPYTIAIGSIALLALALIVRKIVQACLGYASYPAASRFSSSELNKIAKENIAELENANYQVKEIILSKSGYSYKGYIISHKDTKDNGNWQIQALGNGMAAEPFMKDIAEENNKNNLSTLLINGFTTSGSGGHPTRFALGAGFEAGLQYLENEIKAQNIIMHGYSLGGGMMSEAILQHDFSKGVKNGIKYAMISKCTFSKLSDVAAAVVGSIVKPIFFLAGQQLDAASAAKKLIRLNIPHIIVQSSEKSDGVIPKKASVGQFLHDKKLDAFNHTFLESKEVYHCKPLPTDIEQALGAKIRSLTTVSAA